LQLFRLLLLGVFSEQAGAQTGAGSVLSVLVNGLRYDISTAAVWVLPTFLLSLACTALPCTGLAQRLRGLSARLYAVLAILVFGIVHDDTKAILVTIWKEYHPLLFLSIALPLILANLWLIRRWLAYTPTLLHRGYNLGALAPRLGIGFMIFLLMAAAVRGGTLWGEPIRLKHAFVVDDLFLNRSVVNPFTALRYTLKVKFELEKGAALAQFWPSQKIEEALAYELQQRGPVQADTTDIDLALTAQAQGHTGAKPRHIFLLLMESHSGWTVMPAYRHIGLSPQLSALANEGIYFPNFLPAGSGTIGSMNTLITGLPDTGLNINYEATAQQPYPSAIAANMKRLGYTTRFFYGGFLSWQRLDSFAMNQGFDEVYGGGNMSAGVHTNEWGVDDKYLFDFILNTVDDATPSFNFILTTSNHPPYDLDLEALGYPLKQLPGPLRATKSETLKVLGHLWYADRQAGHFVRAAEKQLSRSLFAITGDHTARLRIGFPHDNVVEHSAVPFILYGPNVLPESGVIKKTAGAHLDVPPTLIELAAKSGYPYSRYGEDLLRKTGPGLGWGFIIGEDFIANDTERYSVFGLADGAKPAPHPDLRASLTRLNALKALGWYRVKKGSALPETTAASPED
jgi:phosphoglycerol transferase MdoB-like AlkP superfamily enzyme